MDGETPGKIHFLLDTPLGDGMLQHSASPPPREFSELCRASFSYWKKKKVSIKDREKMRQIDGQRETDNWRGKKL